jgi:hypothetical protein
MRLLAWIVSSLIWSSGFAVLVTNVQPLLPDAHESWTWGERRVAAVVAAVTILGFGIGGWAAGGILRGAAELIGAVAEGAEASVRTAYMIEAHVVPSLTRAAVALERLAAITPGDSSSRAADAIRGAIGEGRWGRAERLLGDLIRDHPGSKEGAVLAQELAAARQAEADELHSRLDAGMTGDEPGEVLSTRDALTRHLKGEALRDMDLQVARWLAGWVRGRIRSGKIDANVAELAARGAERFGDTADGRALLAAVPDLRRRSGLCPGCARPYRGRADACPACLSAPTKGAVKPKGLT